MPLLLLAGCASLPRDYPKEAGPPPGEARVYVYRPHQFEMMWANYEVSLQGKPAKILGDEGFFSADLPPGKLQIRSRHVSEKMIVGLDLALEPNRTYFVKLDPDAGKFSVLGALSDVLAISTVVAGAQAQLRIESGQGSLGDAAKMIQSAGARADLAPKHSLGYHLLLEKEASAAREEIAACCSSKNVDEVREP